MASLEPLPCHPLAVGSGSGRYLTKGAPMAGRCQLQDIHPKQQNMLNIGSTTSSRQAVKSTKCRRHQGSLRKGGRLVTLEGGAAGRAGHRQRGRYGEVASGAEGGAGGVLGAMNVVLLLLLLLLGELLVTSGVGDMGLVEKPLVGTGVDVRRGAGVAAVGVNIEVTLLVALGVATVEVPEETSVGTTEVVGEGVVGMPVGGGCMVVVGI